jgi:ectoine hydroxylase-related dioxygenase (phytanoyl-CoA dioxygenase family)
MSLVEGKGRVSYGKEPAGTAVGMKEMFMKAGDALFFTDAISHGSAERTSEGHRRTVVFRYSPRFIRTRFHYVPSEELMGRLTQEQRKIVLPIAPRRPPE